MDEIKRNPNLIECKVCGKQIAKSAKNCPHCGAPNKMANRKMRLVAIICAVVVLVGAAAGYYFTKGAKGKPEKPKTEAALLKEAITIDWKELDMDMVKNVAAVKQKYEGKPVIVTGYVGYIADGTFFDFSLDWYKDTAYFPADWGDNGEMMRAESSLRVDFVEDYVQANLNEGDKITVVGILTNIGVNMTYLKNAYLIN